MADPFDTASFLAQAGKSTTEKAAKSIRKLEEENILASIGLGLVPYLGSALGGVSAAAAWADPEAGAFERTLATAGTIPFVGPAMKLAKSLRGAKPADAISEIDVFHGGQKHKGPPEAGRIGGEGSYDEGPGFYTTPDVREAQTYATQSRFHGPSAVHKYDLPDEDLPRYIDLDKSFADQTEEIQEALEYMYPPGTPQQYANNPLANYRYDMRASGGFDADFNKWSRQSGIKGTFTDAPAAGRNTGQGVYYSTYDPTELKPLGMVEEFEKVSEYSGDLPLAEVSEMYPELSVSEALDKLKQAGFKLGKMNPEVPLAKQDPEGLYEAGLITEDEMWNLLEESTPNVPSAISPTQSAANILPGKFSPTKTYEELKKAFETGLISKSEFDSQAIGMVLDK
jgi:hypothetical protein